MKWLIHIGTQKTGSKAIQKFLVNEISRIKKNKVCYPKCGRENLWHLPINQELTSGKANLLISAMEEAQQSGAKIGIISSESLYRLKEDKIKIIHSVLGAAKIVLFIRRQDQLVNSLHNQLIKAHRIDHEQITQFEAAMMRYNPHFDHWKTLQKWGGDFWAKQHDPNHL